MMRMGQVSIAVLAALGVAYAAAAFAETPQERKTLVVAQDTVAQPRPVRVVLPAPWEPAGAQAGGTQGTK
jgi:hypothetical protein